MRKLLLVALLVIGFTSSANALVVTAETAEVGYTAAWFQVTSTDVTDTVVKIVVYWAKASNEGSLTRMDSLYQNVTDPGDTIKVSQGTFENGTEYLWYCTVEDTLETVRYPSLISNPNAPYLYFTTDNWVQTNNLLYDGYSTAGIEADTVSATLQSLLDSIRLHLDKTTSAATYNASITTVTDPDTFAVTTLDEGVVYYYKTIAFLADSSIVDTSATGTFTTTDLTYLSSVILASNDSLWIKADSSSDGLAVDSLQLHSGAGTVLAESISITTVTKPDTFIVTGITKGEIHSWTVWAFLTDSSAVESTATVTYTRPHNALLTAAKLDRDYFPRNFTLYTDWDFDSHTDDFSTNKLPIDFSWLRVHAIIDGEDDWATSDSINVFLWSHALDGDSTAIDTIITLEDETITATPLKYRMGPGEITDSSMTYFPQFDWGVFYSISADMSNDDGQGDSATALGVRGVHIVVEEIE